MKILYLHQYFTTPNGAGGSRSYEFARRWVKARHHVHVVTGTAYDETLPKNGTVEIDGIRVTSVGSHYNTEMGFFQRLKAFFHYAVKAVVIAARGRKYDLVLATSTPLTVALPALAAKWGAGRKVIFEVRDVWPDAAVDAGVLKNRWLILMAGLLEKAAYLSSSHIVPLSTGMLNRITDKGIDLEKMTMIPNCSDTATFHPGIDGKDLRKQFQAENNFIVIYAGAVNVANNIEYLLKVAELSANMKDMEFWIVGNGNRFEYLKAQVKKRRLGNIRLHGRQPKHRMPLYMAAADAGVVTFISQPVYYDNSPNKFFDYIAAGLPVLFNRTTWLEQYLSEYQNGFVCNPDQPETMVERLSELKNDVHKRIWMGTRSRKLAEEVFSRDRMSDKYLELFQMAMNGHYRGMKMVENHHPSNVA